MNITLEVLFWLLLKLPMLDAAINKTFEKDVTRNKYLNFILLNWWNCIGSIISFGVSISVSIWLLLVFYKNSTYIPTPIPNSQSADFAVAYYIFILIYSILFGGFVKINEYRIAYTQRVGYYLYKFVRYFVPEGHENLVAFILAYTLTATYFFQTLIIIFISVKLISKLLTIWNNR